MPIKANSTEAALGFARALIESSQLPLVLFDAELRVICASRSFYSAFDITDEAEGRALAEIGGGGWDMPQLTLLIESALAGGPQMADYEADLTRLGMPPRRLQLNVQALAHDAPDARILLAITDVTRAREAERRNVILLLEKDDLLRERANLLDEMQHRVANSLQIIASVLLLKARAVKSEETRRHLNDAHSRVMSIAAVQQHLQFTTGDVVVGPYLTKLCGSLSSSIIEEGRGLTISVVSQQAVVKAREAVSLGLVVTELVINALKHGFPDGREGLIRIRYAVEPDGWVLTVADDGVGMGANQPVTKGGLGTSIVQGLARQLGATAVTADAAPGLRVTLRGEPLRPPN